MTSWGNEQQDIFRDELDRFHLLDLFGELSETDSVRVHSYVLMDNHYHLILETLEANLSPAMQWFNVIYSSWFNRRHRRVGHLFQGRFNAIIVEPGDWAVALSR